MKASVLDKIRADFNVDKKDRCVHSDSQPVRAELNDIFGRCVQLVWSSDYENPTAWAELISKVKEGILYAFDIAVAQREEEVRRSEGQRQMPGWNFCTYFLLKVPDRNSISFADRAAPDTFGLVRKALRRHSRA